MLTVIPKTLHFTENSRIDAVKFLKLVNDQRNGPCFCRSRNDSNDINELLRLSQYGETCCLDILLQSLAKCTFSLPRNQ